MFRSFNPLLNALQKAKKAPINLHLQDTAVSSHIKSGGKGINQFARVRTEYKYPLRSKIADVLQSALVATLIGGSLVFLTLVVSTIPLNTTKSIELQAKEKKAQEMRELEAAKASKA